MTREELLELAALDAFGLLDEYEAALYTRSFHHAPAAVQDEVKQRQASFAADPAFLPEVEPESELRRRVLGAVARAVESESGELAPLALIGRTHTGRGATLHRSSNGAASHFWRAAALVLAAGNIVFAYFGIQFHRDFVAMTTTLLQDHTQTAIETEIGGEFYPDYVNSPFCEEVLLTSPNGAKMTAWVYVKEHQDRPGHSLFVVARGMPHLKGYRLEGRLGDAAPLVVEFLSGTSGIATARIDVGNVPSEFYASFAQVSWKIVDVEQNDVVLTYSA